MDSQRPGTLGQALNLLKHLYFVTFNPKNLNLHHSSSTHTPSLGDHFSKIPKRLWAKGIFGVPQGWQWPLSLSQGGLRDQHLAGQVLQVRRLRRVQLNVVLGQDFEDGPQPQPPLLLGDAVPEGGQDTDRLGTSPGRDPRLCPTFRGRDREGTRTRNPSAGAARRWAGTPGCACASPAGRQSQQCWQRSGLEGHGNVWEPPGRWERKGGSVGESSGMGEHGEGEGGNVQDAPGARVGNVWDRPGARVGNVWDPPGGNVGNVWDAPGRENPWEGRWGMFGTFQERKFGNIWDLPGTLEGRLGIFGIIQEQGTPPRICGKAFWECFGNVGSLWDSLSSSTHHAESTP